MNRLALLFLLAYSSSCAPQSGLPPSILPVASEGAATPNQSSLLRTGTAPDSPNPSPLAVTATDTPADASIISTMPDSSRTLTTTKTPSAAIWPDLAPQGPYLLYRVGGAIVVMNPDGSGRRILDIPEGMEWESISPTGEWVLVGTSQGIMGEYDPRDFHLSAVHIPDGTVHPLGLIASKETINAYMDVCYECGMFYWSGQQSWSPDGRYLAFTANPTGASVDLYVFDAISQAVHQLTKSRGDIVWLLWSPDSRRILLETGIPPIVDKWGCYSSTEFRLAVLGQGLNSGMKDLPIKDQYCMASASGGYALAGWQEWAGDTAIAYYSPDYAEDVDRSPLSILNPDTLESNVIWRGSLYSWQIAFDPEEAALLLIDWSRSAPAGYHLLSMEGDMLARPDLDYTADTHPEFRGGGRHRFLVLDTNGVFGISQTGAARKISDKAYPSISRSPDSRWLVISDGQGIEIYSEMDELVAGLGLIAYSIHWRTDSTGFNFMAKLEDRSISLYFWTVGDLSPVKVFSFPPDDPFSPQGGFLWVE